MKVLVVVLVTFVSSWAGAQGAFVGPAPMYPRDPNRIATHCRASGEFIKAFDGKVRSFCTLENNDYRPGDPCQCTYSSTTISEQQTYSIKTIYTVHGEATRFSN